MTNKNECNCDFCIKCKKCGHRADEHMCGDGPCYIKDCTCTWFEEPFIPEGKLENMKTSEVIN